MMFNGHILVQSLQLFMVVSFSFYMFWRKDMVGDFTGIYDIEFILSSSHFYLQIYIICLHFVMCPRNHKILQAEL